MKSAPRIAIASVCALLAGTGLAMAAGGGSNGSSTSGGSSSKKSGNAPQPKPLGVYKDWTAATYGSGADKTCYAFAMSEPAGSKTGAGSGSAGSGSAGSGSANSGSAGKSSNQKSGMLTVAEREKYRDEVSVSQGINYTKGASVEVSVGSTKLDFFTHDDMAYAMKGKDVVKAFLSGHKAEVKATAPHAKPVTDTFSLEGFSDAYKAIEKACPEQSGSGKASSSSK